MHFQAHTAFPAGRHHQKLGNVPGGVVIGLWFLSQCEYQAYIYLQCNRISVEIGDRPAIPDGVKNLHRSRFFTKQIITNLVGLPGNFYLDYPVICTEVSVAEAHF